MSEKWNYGDAYKRHNMEGIIEVGGGKLKVHNLFDPLPEFMKEADVIFCDPPCSKGNINTFYTKADRTDYQESYEPFEKRFFEIVDEIKPKKLFVEVFKSNWESFTRECGKRYKYVTSFPSTYYHNKNNKCWVIVAENNPADYPFFGMDEENVIEWICKNVDYKCIADPCMGQGLVGYNAFLNGRKFVGTELNKKRLAVLVEKIKNSQNMLQ